MDTDKAMKAVGAEIRAEAAAQRVSLNALAAAAGIVRTTLYKYLDAERDMPLGVFLALSDRLGIGADVLMTRAEQRASRSPQGRGDME